jgi:hypothetical protein
MRRETEMKEGKANMPKPEYPTREGLWSRGRRQEETFERVRLEMPYPEAVEHFRQAVKGRDDFDPAVLLVWGTMQATAVLNIMRTTERGDSRHGWRGLSPMVLNAVTSWWSNERTRGGGIPGTCIPMSWENGH